MNYDELKKLLKMGGGYKCLFGAGLIGCTWAYDLMKAMGCKIDFYCDNNKEEGLEIREGVRTISLDKLYALKDDVLVFVTVAYKYQNTIIKQLEKNGIQNIIVVDYLFMQTFMEELLKKNDRGLNEQFKHILDDKEYISRQFKYYFGYYPNLDSPKTFNEKLQWLKLFNRKPEYIRMVDKYEAKKYIAENIGEQYIIPTLGVYESFDKIDFDVLPRRFVLKCTHDSGSVVICRDKYKFDKENAKRLFEWALKRNFDWASREWPYKNVKPKIIAEQYMADESNDELKDYKFFCFNGKVKIVQVDYDRFKGHKRNLYTTDWEYINAVIKYPTDAKRKIKRPKRLEEMVALSKALSKGIPHVRTDFYSIADRIYFGEMTFYHGGGYEEFAPQKWDGILGEWIELPKTMSI